MIRLLVFLFVCSLISVPAHSAKNKNNDRDKRGRYLVEYPGEGPFDFHLRANKVRRVRSVDVYVDDQELIRKAVHQDLRKMKLAIVNHGLEEESRNRYQYRYGGLNLFAEEDGYDLIESFLPYALQNMSEQDGFGVEAYDLKRWHLYAKPRKLRKLDRKIRRANRVLNRLKNRLKHLAKKKKRKRLFVMLAKRYKMVAKMKDHLVKKRAKVFAKKKWKVRRQSAISHSIG